MHDQHTGSLQLCCVPRSAWLLAQRNISNDCFQHCRAHASLHSQMSRSKCWGHCHTSCCWTPHRSTQMGRSSLCAQQATAKANNVLIRLVSTYVQYAKMLHSIATRRTQQQCGSAIAEDKPANNCANQSCKKGTSSACYAA